MERLTGMAVFGLAVLFLASCNPGQPQPTVDPKKRDDGQNQAERPPQKKDELVAKKTIKTFDGDWRSFEEKWRPVTETKVRVRFDAKKRVQFRYVVWEGGKQNPSPLYDPQFLSGDEANFAMQEADDRDKVVRKITMKIAVGIYPFVGVQFPHHTSSGFIAPVTAVRFKDDEPSAFVDVWAFGVGEDCKPLKGETCQEFAKRAEWAVVYSVAQTEAEK